MKFYLILIFFIFFRISSESQVRFNLKDLSFKNKFFTFHVKKTDSTGGHKSNDEGYFITTDTGYFIKSKSYLGILEDTTMLWVTYAPFGSVSYGNKTFFYPYNFVTPFYSLEVMIKKFFSDSSLYIVSRSKNKIAYSHRREADNDPLKLLKLTFNESNPLSKQILVEINILDRNGNRTEQVTIEITDQIFPIERINDFITKEENGSILLKGRLKGYSLFNYNELFRRKFSN